MNNYDLVKGSQAMLSTDPFSNLIKNVKNIKNPQDYRHGIIEKPPPLPYSILVFHRSDLTLLSNDISASHYHNRFVLWINMETEATFFVDGGKFFLIPDHAFLIFPNQVHYFYHTPGVKKINWLFITFYFSGNSQLLLPIKNRQIYLPTISREIIETVVEEFLSIQNNNNDPTDFISVKLAELLHELLKSKNKINLANNNSEVNNPEGKIIDQINQYINDNPNWKISIDDLSENLGISESHLRMLFRKRVGLSLGKYLRESRIRRAIDAIITSETSFSEIASQYGFESVFSFSRLFKNVTGISPSEYRKKYQNWGHLENHVQ